MVTKWPSRQVKLLIENAVSPEEYRLWLLRGTPVRTNASIYEKLIDDYLNESRRDNPGTGCVFSALIGAMSVARVVSDEALSREISKMVAKFLKNYNSEHGAVKRA
jgi:predicted DNA-binding protein (UPF0278 family)